LRRTTSATSTVRTARAGAVEDANTHSDARPVRRCLDDDGHPLRSAVLGGRALAAFASLFPHLPERSAFHKRRLRLSGVIEGLIAEFAKHSPWFYDDMLLACYTT